MSRWLISVPSWGPHYRNLTKAAVLPSLAAALRQSSTPAKIIVHTDYPDDFAFARSELGLDVEFQHADPAREWAQYPECHHAVMKMAQPGDFVSCLCADIAVSIEFFVAMEKYFSEGKRVVVSEGTRTLSDDTPPIAVNAYDLLSWTMARLHPIVQQCFWGKGRTSCPSVIYFCDGQGIVKHCFHMGPIGFVWDERNYLMESSIDGAFIESFTREEIKVALPREMCMVECSTEKKAVAQVWDEPFTRGQVVYWAKLYATPIHRFLFRHPMLMEGHNSGSSRLIVQTILAEVEAALAEAAGANA